MANGNSLMPYAGPQDMPEFLWTPGEEGQPGFRGLTVRNQPDDPRWKPIPNTLSPRPNDPNYIVVPPHQDLPPASGTTIPESMGGPRQLVPGGAIAPPANALAPREGAPTGAPSDPDAGKVLPNGMPVSLAKQFIRNREPGIHGYNAAFGYKYGLPAGLPANDVGFPVFEGRPIPASMYGGKYAGKVSHAFGMYQIQDGTWRTAAEGLAKEGVNITDYSPESQEKIATWLLMHGGMSHWRPYNSLLDADLASYEKTGQLPQFAGPVAHWEPGYKPGAAALSRPPGATTELPEVTAVAPAGATARQYAPPPSLESEGGMARAMKGMYLMQLFNQMAQGRKFTPVDYDPWKVRETTRQQSPNYSLSVGVQGVGAGIGPYAKMGVYGS